MSGPDRGGLHPDPDDPNEPRPDPATWTPLLTATASSTALACYRDALRLDGSVRAGVVRDLADYYEFTDDQVVHRCVHWEEWSTEEWLSEERSTADAINDFYRTTRSWSFDLLWFAYLQAEMYRYPVSAAIATSLAERGRVSGRHLDFGCGVGVTSQMFSRLGFESEMADISTSMLDFAQFRTRRRAESIRSIDLNDEAIQAGQYDVVTAIDTLVHIPDLERVLCELHAAIAPGGRLFANFAVRPRTAENSQFLYDDELPLRRMIQRVGFEQRRRLDGMITEYERVEPTGWRHLARRARTAVALSPLRPIAKNARARVRSALRR
ncbi:MAG: methyltransferase type 11 [Acidimicrobiaceae bacterium]|nr:methyltransferase type 11 [Acidimicrobiaceae bacterium]